MTDILTRLKNWEHIYEEELNGDDGDLYLAAADEVKRLRNVADDLAEVLREAEGKLIQSRETTGLGFPSLMLRIESALSKYRNKE